MSNSTKNVVKIALWGVKVSPYVRKVMIALAEKNISYTHIEILPKLLLDATKQEVPAEFTQISPLGKIPVLQLDNFSIADSAVIARYLDNKFLTGQRLYPENPEEFARALWFEHYSDNVLSEIAYKQIFLERIVKPLVLSIPADEEIVKTAMNHALPPILDYLNREISANKWLAGNNFSMADVAVATQLQALEMAGYTIDSVRWKALQDYFKAVTARSSFSEL